MGSSLSHVNVAGAVTTTRLSSYDAVSNRITGMTENSAALRTYAYDGGGNIVTDTRPGEAFAFTYNARNRMASVTRNGASYASYSYNAFELMVSRTTAAPGGPIGTVHYIYDTGGHLIAEADAATGVTTREYIWLPANDNSPVDLPIAIAEAGAIYHVHADHLGRPTAMTNGSKATVWQATWKPWGEIQSISGTLANTLRYPGQYFQIETSLHYNWHRHYDPVTGRYTQPDPLGFVDGPSIYAYARSSPYMHTDRDGRYAHILVQGAIMATLKGIELCMEVPMCRKAIEKYVQMYLAIIAGTVYQHMPKPGTRPVPWLDSSPPPLWYPPPPPPFIPGPNAGHGPGSGALPGFGEGGGAGDPAGPMLPPLYSPTFPPLMSAVPSSWPRTGQCNASEIKHCETQCGARGVKGCYVTIGYRIKGVRANGPIRSQQPTINCNCGGGE